MYLTLDVKRSRDFIDDFLPLKNRERILDIGGGTGIITDYLNEKGHEVHILDPSVYLIEQCSNTSIPLILGDGCHLPFKQKSYDTALLLNTIHHIPHSVHTLLFSQIYEVLKEHGKLFIIDLEMDNNTYRKVFKRLDGVFSGGVINYRDSTTLSQELKTLHFKSTTINHNVYNKEGTRKSWRYCLLAQK